MDLILLGIFTKFYLQDIVVRYSTFLSSYDFKCVLCMLQLDIREKRH